VEGGRNENAPPEFSREAQLSTIEIFVRFSGEPVNGRKQPEPENKNAPLSRGAQIQHGDFSASFSKLFQRASASIFPV